jgi:phytoene synthase
MPQPLPDPATQYAADVAACRKLLSCGSRTFFAASFLLPTAIRGSASVLYAFCRLADDAVDVADNGAVGLLNMRERLDLAYAGTPLQLPADRAFAHVVAKYAMPRELPEALLEGFEWDVLDRRYDDFEQVQAYAARVAGSVGAMMAVLMGVRDPDVVARACDLGCAMQLSNIARDVGEDARMGRLYLPRQWLAEAGLDADRWLQQPDHCHEIAIVIQRLLRAADDIYERVDAGIERLPAMCRPGIRAARLLYAEIGHQVGRHAFDSVTRRAVVSGWRKTPLLARALIAPATDESTLTLPPLEAVRFLVDALVRHPEPSAAALGADVPSFAGQNIGERFGWVIVLFGQIEQRNKTQMVSARSRLHQPISVRPVVPEELPWWNLGERILWVFELGSHLERHSNYTFTASEPPPLPLRPTLPEVPWWNFRARIRWVIELFVQLERTEQFPGAQTRH